MKILVVSDIHGSVEGVKEILRLDRIISPDQIVCCGDVYHGSFLSYGGQDERDMANLFSYVVTKLHFVLGNNDRKEDEDFSPVGFAKFYQTTLGNHRVIFAHGHRRYSGYELTTGDIYCTGHTHCARLINMNGIYLCNPGSISQPRDNTMGTYLVLDEEKAVLYELDDTVYETLYFEGERNE
jgi:putative phosphoesterase